MLMLCAPHFQLTYEENIQGSISRRALYDEFLWDGNCQLFNAETTYHPKSGVKQCKCEFQLDGVSLKGSFYRSIFNTYQCFYETRGQSAGKQ